ncbi:MAG: glycosyltransferase family 39 protein [Saprospiraceae bacterium]|nr:glycosyltransferase family 39 protein [Saprospiraceae bacterium]
MENRKKEITKWIHISIILLLYTAVNLFLYNWVSIDYLSDGEIYNGIAQALLNCSDTINQPSVRNHGGDIGQMLMPGFSVLLFLIYSVFGNNLMHFVWFQIILSGVSIVVFYQVLRRLTSSDIAFILCVLLVLFVEIWRYNFAGMMEATTVSLLIFLTHFLDKFIRKQNFPNVIYFSIISFVLVAINNRFIVHVFLAFVLLLWSHRKDLNHLIKISLGGILFILLMLPWHIRQYGVYDKFVVFAPERNQLVNDVSEQTEIILSYEEYIDDLKIPSVDRMDIDDWLPLFTEAKYHQLVEEYHNQKRGYKADRFIGFFEVIRTDFRLGYGNRTDLIYPPNIYGSKQQMRLFLHLVVYGLGFLILLPSLIFTLQKKDLLSLTGFAFFVAHIFVHTYILYIPQYRLTIVPIIILLSANGLQQIFKWKESLQK